MSTVAGKIDLHTHILPKTWPDLQKRYGYGGFISLDHLDPCRATMRIDGKPFREIHDNAWSPERRIEDCDRAGVGMQVLSTVPVMFSYWARPQDGLDLSRLLNDHIAEVISNYPKRFTGLGTLPLQKPGLAVQELERCVRELKLPGVQIGTHVNGLNLDDPTLFPVFEAAESLGAAIFIHPWDMLARERMEKYWLRWLVGMPAETAIAACSLIFGGVLDRLPKLRVCFAHGGGSFPGTIGRIDHGYNVRPDLVAVNQPASPREYVNRCYVDSLVHDPVALRYLLDLMSAERIALGSDYPFPLGEAHPGSLIESLPDLTPGERDRMLFGTAREFLALDKVVQ